MLIYNLPTIEPWKHSNSFLRSDVPDNLIGSWRFGEAGDTDADSRVICSRNRAPGAANEAADRLVVGAPTVFPDYFRFLNGTDALRTQIAEPSEFCIYAVVRSIETDISGGASPAYLGWYGGTPTKGSYLLGYATAAFRWLTYQNTVTPALVPVTLSVPTAGQAWWRVLYMHVTEAELAIINLTGDSVIDEPAPHVMSGGHVEGTGNFSIGSVYATYLTKTCDIHRIDLYDVAHDAGQRATKLAEIRRGLAQTALVEGAV